MFVDLLARRAKSTLRRRNVDPYSPNTKRLLRIEVLIVTSSELRRGIDLFRCDGNELVLLKGMLFVAAGQRASAHRVQPSCSEGQERAGQTPQRRMQDTEEH